MELPILNNPNVHIARQTISKPIKAFVIDFFNNASFEVAAKLGIPTHYYYTSGASSLAVFLYILTIDRNTTKSFKDFDDDELIDISGAPSLHGFNFPKHMMDRTNKIYKAIIDTAVQMAKSKGIITNTFEALEPRAFKALMEGLCVLDGQAPPVYCIGPLISAKEQSVCDNGVNQHECLSWLKSQPSKSLVFLCFGSMGLFSGEQLTKMAIGLEKSGHRFLWVVRNPPTDDHNKSNLSILTPPDPNLDEILPKGFTERTKDRGLVVKSWAPQVDVLNHDSVGGFVTHCGWNSVLEALSAGVPMIAWPLYAEQRSNMVFMVEEMKIALSVNESGDGSVSAAELEERVRELLESEKGKEVRDKVLDMKDVASAERVGHLLLP